jgi:rhodanese-related sulfurtransferase
MSRQCDLSFQQKNLFQQGFQTYTPAELRQIHWGLRFTPGICSLITAYALYVQDPVLLLAVAALGMWAFFFPAGHPMDLLYNHGIRHLFKAVKLPPNPLQRRLACFAAGIMNTLAAVFFLLDFPVAALVTGGMLLALQAIVIFTHFCTLSWMFEGIMRMLGQWSVPVDEKKARELLDSDAIIVDVRGPDEFANEHLYSAKNYPLDSLEQSIEDLRGKPMLVYCASGTRSQIAKQKLNRLGLNEVYDLGAFSRAKALLNQA